MSWSRSHRWCCWTSRLANLDVHLHASMEREFSRFHERTGTTMIYITHDQAEAMALSDRIAVMDKGRVLQVATPAQLYREPADEMVASFIGEGSGRAGGRSLERGRCNLRDGPLRIPSAYATRESATAGTHRARLLARQRVAHRRA